MESLEVLSLSSSQVQKICKRSGALCHSILRACLHESVIRTAQQDQTLQIARLSVSQAALITSCYKCVLKATKSGLSSHLLQRHGIPCPRTSLCSFPAGIIPHSHLSEEGPNKLGAMCLFKGLCARVDRPVPHHHTCDGATWSQTLRRRPSDTGCLLPTHFRGCQARIMHALPYGT